MEGGFETIISSAARPQLAAWQRPFTVVLAGVLVAVVSGLA
jgi:hypothetical protein